LKSRELCSNVAATKRQFFNLSVGKKDIIVKGNIYIYVHQPECSENLSFIFFNTCF